MIVGSQEEGVLCVIDAQVPLAEMFGYSTVLRSSTQGQAQFTMEFAAYRPVPKSIAEELLKKTTEEKKNVA
jgi:elongation factor G